MLRSKKKGGSDEVKAMELVTTHRCTNCMRKCQRVARLQGCWFECSFSRYSARTELALTPIPGFVPSFHIRQSDTGHAWKRKFDQWQEQLLIDCNCRVHAQIRQQVVLKLCTRNSQWQKKTTPITAKDERWRGLQGLRQCTAYLKETLTFVKFSNKDSWNVFQTSQAFHVAFGKFEADLSGKDKLQTRPSDGYCRSFKLPSNISRASKICLAKRLANTDCIIS